MSVVGRDYMDKHISTIMLEGGNSRFEELANSEFDFLELDSILGEFAISDLEFEDDDEEEVECCSNEPIGRPIGLDGATISNAKKTFDILIEIDQDHKKVVNVTDFKDLEHTFLKAFAEDSLEEFIDADVIFQMFSDKFNTWVNLDKSFKLSDGTHLKAVFRKKQKLQRSSAHRPSNSHSHKDKKAKKRRRSSSLDKYRHDKHKSRKRSRSKSSDREREKYQFRNGSCSLSDESDKYRKSRTPQSLSSDDERGQISTTTPTCYSRSSYQRPRYDNYNYVHSQYRPEQFETNHVPVEEGEWEEEDAENVDYEPVSKGEMRRIICEIADKNPISALHELCSKLKWQEPKFEMHRQNLCPTDPRFLMKVTIRGETYIPETISRKKKAAKTLAAEFCLKKLGILKEREGEQEGVEGNEATAA